MNQLEQLKQFSRVVADTGDFHQLARFAPEEATTNPSLVLKAAQMDAYRPLLEQAVGAHRHEPVARIADRVLVAFGAEILKIVPGRVSTEVDARLSFDRAATVTRAHDILRAYDDAGVDRSRVLIKIAATWEGIQAAGDLARQGVKTNLTLLFCMAQACACAEAGVQLISPFVGRIYDWYKKAGAYDASNSVAAEDHGVASVRRIYNYYKQHGIQTEVMAASFRSAEQIIALAGCDLLTISPQFLAELSAVESPVKRSLDDGAAEAIPRIDRIVLDESAFRLAMSEDPMATEKLAEGVHQFVADAVALEQLVEECKTGQATPNA